MWPVSILQPQPVNHDLITTTCVFPWLPRLHLGCGDIWESIVTAMTETRNLFLHTQMHRIYGFITDFMDALF